MVVLEVEDHLGTPAELLPRRITSDGERTTSLGLPHVLLVVVVLRADDDPLGKGNVVEATPNCSFSVVFSVHREMGRSSRYSI